MASERLTGPTPLGGDYCIAVYVRLATLDEVDKDQTDGVIVSEFSTRGEQLGETILSGLRAQ
jgi:hypothetical protein